MPTAGNQKWLRPLSAPARTVPEPPPLTALAAARRRLRLGLGDREGPGGVGAARPSGTACGRGWPAPWCGRDRSARHRARRPCAGWPGRRSGRRPRGRQDGGRDGRRCEPGATCRDGSRGGLAGAPRHAGSPRRRPRRTRSRWPGTGRGPWTGRVGGGSGSPCPEDRRVRAPLRRVGRPCPRRRRVTVPVWSCAVRVGPFQYPARTLRESAPRRPGRAAISRRCPPRRPGRSRSAASNSGAHGPWPASDVRRLLELLVRLRVGDPRLRTRPDRVALALPRVAVAEHVEVQLDRRRLVEPGRHRADRRGDEVGIGAARVARHPVGERDPGHLEAAGQARESRWASPGARCPGAGRSRRATSRARPSAIARTAGPVDRRVTVPSPRG